jgi:Tfp pilus assembly protein PilE
MLAGVKRRPRRRLEGLSMVEIAAIVCVVGILLAVFIPTFFRELRTSKTSEAAENLQDLYQRSAAYFVARRDSDDGVTRTACLPPTAGPTPRVPTTEPEAVDFYLPETAGHETWRALGFAPTMGLRFAYTFEPTASGCGLRSPGNTYLLTLRAEGDLDGDGERSVFERRARANDTGELEPSDVLYVRDRVE